MKQIFKIATLFSIVLFFSCDKDYNSIGAEVIGDEHFELDNYVVTNLDATLKEAVGVQSNNLAINALGIYNNPTFGTTKAHFVTQIELKTVNPVIGESPEIVLATDSVYMYIPFFSTLEETDEDGNNTYTLDSIYGDIEQKFNLKLLENGYYLRDFDPTVNLQDRQKYYSNQTDLFFNPALIGTTLLNNSNNTSQNTEFVFNEDEIIIYKTNAAGEKLDKDGEPTTDSTKFVVKERKKPGIWIDLDRNFMQNKILNASSDQLFNNSAFKEYFKGIVFQVEEIIPGQGAMAMLDFAKAEIKMQYHAIDAGEIEAEKKEIEFKIGYDGSASFANTVNLLESNNSTAYQNAIDTNQTDYLYIKGGQGTIAYIDVFDATELQNLKDNNWLINDAKLTFYIEKNLMSANKQSEEPERICLFDAENNTPIFDYFYDTSTSSNTKRNKYIYDGIIDREEVADANGQKKGIKYTIRLTQHIKRILDKENDDDEANNYDNVRLGLSVTGNINNAISAAAIGNGTAANPEFEIPAAAVFEPLGTILYGTTNSDATKKMQLKIYYTKPN